MSDRPRNERITQIPDPTLLRMLDETYGDICTVRPYIPPPHLVPSADVPDEGTPATVCNQWHHATINSDGDLASDATEYNELHQATDESDPDLTSDADPAVLDGPAGTDARKCKDLQGFQNHFSPPPEDGAPKCNELQHATDDSDTRCSELEPPEGDAAQILPTDFAGVLTDSARMVLSARQQRALMLLVAGHTDTDFARNLGIDRTTIWRWKQNRNFRLVLNEARELVFGASIDRLRALAPRAIDVLETDLESGKNPYSAIRLLRLIGVERHAKEK